MVRQIIPSRLAVDNARLFSNNTIMKINCYIFIFHLQFLKDPLDISEQQEYEEASIFIFKIQTK